MAFEQRRLGWKEVRNYTLLLLGIANIVVGIMGLCGYQINLPAKYDGYTWTKKYIQGNGFARIIFGIPWAVLFFVPGESEISLKKAIIIAFLGALPSLIFDIWHSVKFKKILKREIELRSTNSGDTVTLK